MLRSDLIIAGSNFIFSHIKENYYEYLNDKKNYLVIFRGINTDYFDPSTTIETEEDELFKSWGLKIERKTSSIAWKINRMERPRNVFRCY